MLQKFFFIILNIKEKNKYSNKNSLSLCLSIVIYRYCLVYIKL